MVGPEKSEILLEPGDGERIILSVRLGGQLYGFDVTKAAEIWFTSASSVKPLAEAGPAVEGMLRLRGQTAFVVDLPSYFSGAGRPHDPRDLFLAIRLGGRPPVVFRVQSVAGIDCLSGREVRRADPGESGISAGTALCAGEEVSLLDIVKIAEALLPLEGQEGWQEGSWS